MRKKKVKPATVVSYVILTIFALIVLVPFIWFVSTSFDYVKSYSLRFPPRLIPKEFSTFNYKMAFSNVPMLSYLKNTVIIVALSAVLPPHLQDLHFQKENFRERKSFWYLFFPI